MLSNKTIFVIILVVFAISIFIVSCGSCGKGGSTNHNAPSIDDLAEKCTEKCADEKTYDCCKTCCKGNYVWTPEKCLCQDS